MIRYVVGFDAGTSSMKAVLMDDLANAVQEYSEEYGSSITPEGGVEQDPGLWTGACKSALEAFRRRGADLHHIAAVCPTGMHRSLVLLDGGGKPVRDAIIWSDIRCAKQVDQAAAEQGEAIRSVTHTRLITAATLPRILWLRETDPGSWQRTGTFLYPSNYIAYSLTGVAAMDRNNASASSLYDLSSHAWSETLTRLFAVEQEKLPPLLDCLDIQGYVTGPAARETGLREGTPVVAGCGDVAAELYSAGVRNSDVCKIRLGSAGDISSVIHKDELPARRRAAVFDYFPKDRYIDSNYILTCAQSVKWARSVLFSELGQRGAYQAMDREAAAPPPGADGILFHPYLLGENSPYFDPNLRAMFHGLALSHTRGHLLRAVYEGVCYSFRNVMDKSGLLERCRSIVAVGGGTRSELWLSILVNVLGRECVIPPHCDAAYGAALMAGEGIGLWKSADVLKRNRSQRRIIRPEPKEAQFYAERFPAFREIAEAGRGNDCG